MILIVEDNKTNQSVLLAVLGMKDYQTEVVSNGAEAVEFFKAKKPELILMDISMPVMNGYDATRAIRGIEKTLSIHTPIIAISAHIGLQDQQQCKECGMDGYIPKPILPDHLLQTIEDFLRGQMEEEQTIA